MVQLTTSRRRCRLIAGALAMVVVALTAVASPALADSYDPQRRAAEARAAQADQAAQAIAASIEGLNAQLAQAVLDLQATQARLVDAQAELAAAQQTLERSQREAVLIAARLQDAQVLEADVTAKMAADDARTAQVRIAVGQLARRAYKGETAATSLAVVVEAKTSQDFVIQYAMVATALRIQTRSLGDLRQVAAASRNSKARLTAVTNEIALLKVDADRKVAEAEAAKAAAVARQAEIEQLLADQAAKQAVVTGMKAAAEADQATIDAQRTVLAAELAGILAKQRAAQAAAGSAGTCTPGTGGGGTAGPGATLPASIGPFHGEQIINAAQIIIAANDLGIDVRGQAVAVMTAIGESTLINVDHGDFVGPDSRGLFQQRANGAWGSYADRMNPRIAATSFFHALLQVPGWESMAPTLAAHDVQRNADPYHYAPSWTIAVLIVGTLGGDPNLRCQ